MWSPRIRRWFAMGPLVALSIAVVSQAAPLGTLAVAQSVSSQQWAAFPKAETGIRSRAVDRFNAPKCNGSNSVTSQDGRYLFTNEWLGKGAFLCVIDLREQKLVKRVLLKKSKKAHVGTISLSRDGGLLFIDVSDVERHPVLGLGFSYGSVVTVDTKTFNVVDSFTPLSESPSGYEEGMSIFGLNQVVDDTVVFAVHGSHNGRHGYLLTANVQTGYLDILSARAPNDINSIVISSDGRTLWALGNRLDRIDSQTGRVLATSSAVGGTFPKIYEGSLALSPDEQALHIIDSSRRTYTILDAETLRVKMSTRLSYIPTALAMAPNGRRTWILVQYPLPRVPVTWPPPEIPDEVWAFDPQGRKTNRTVLPDAGSAESLVLDPSGSEGYITYRLYPNPSEVLVFSTR